VKLPLAPEKLSDLQPLRLVPVDLRQLRHPQHRRTVLVECSCDLRFSFSVLSRLHWLHRSSLFQPSAAIPLFSQSVAQLPPLVS
jgi:hypothetical protein